MLAADRNRWRHAFVIAVVVHLAVLYSPRAVSVPDSIIGWDKLAHMAIFGAVLWVGVRAGYSARLLTWLLVINAFASELFQYAFFSHRSGDVYDVIADLLGVAIAALLVRRSSVVAV